MSTLLIFVLGILFIEFVIPIIEAIAVLIATALEVLKGKMMVSITACNKQIQELSEEEEPPHNAIGFVVPNYEEEEDEE